MKRLARHWPLLLAVLCMYLPGCQTEDHVVQLKSVVQGSSNAYQLSFEGVKSVPRQVLLKAAASELEQYAQGGLRPSAIDDAAFNMELLYRDRGFPFAKVSYAIEHTPPAKPNIEIRVSEGQRMVMGHVEFDGHTQFSSDELESQIGGLTTRPFGLGKLYFVQAEVDSAATSMESLYYQSGFLDVRVPRPEVLFDYDAGRAQVTYHISEGLHYTIGDLTIAPTGIAKLLKLDRTLDHWRGADFYPRVSTEMQSSLAARLANLGHADARCEAQEQIDSETGEVHITLQLDPGPLVRIGQLRLIGNQSTRASTIRSLIELRPGELYSRKAEHLSFRNLYASGLFSSVKLALLGDGPLRDLRVQVEEAATLSTSFELGYGAYERARVLFGVTEKNLFGTGRSLRFEGKLAQRARSAELFFSDPYSIDRKHVLGATAFIERRKLVSFDSQMLGAGINLNHTISKNYHQIYGHEYRISQAGNVDVVLPGLDPALFNDVNVSTLYLTNVYDTRDNFFMPTAGTWFRLRSELASASLGSRLDFLRFDGRLAHYFPLGKGQQLALHLRGGMIIPTEDTQVIPLQERFYNGGQNTVRSFREDELGPHDINGEPIGGEAYSLFSSEYRAQLFTSVSAAFFFDAGNVSLDHSDVLRARDLRYAVGPGLRWMLPIGPLRLDWGINPKPRQFEDNWVVQFSLGVAF